MRSSSSESDAMASSKGEFGGGGIAFVYASEMCVFFVLQHVCLIEKKRSIDVATRSLFPLSLSLRLLFKLLLLC